MKEELKAITWEDYINNIPPKYRMKKKDFNSLVKAFPGLLVDNGFWDGFDYEEDVFDYYVITYATGDCTVDMYDFDEVDVDEKTYELANNFETEQFLGVTETLSKFGWTMKNKEEGYHDAISSEIGIDFDELLENISQMPKTTQEYVVRKVRLACVPQ